MERRCWENPHVIQPCGLEDFQEIYPTIRRVAEVRAAGVARVYGLSETERKDLEQDAVSHVWRNLDRYDASRSSLKTFVERIVANLVTSYLRHTCAWKRCPEFHNGVARSALRWDDAANLRADVRRTLRTLPPQQLRICRLLMTYSAVEVSRRMGLPRCSLYRIMSEIRVTFTEAGLHHWSQRRLL